MLLQDERYQAKISYFGLKFMRNEITRETKGRLLQTLFCINNTLLDLLWTAPELLRNGDEWGTKAGDIYAFAIICSEIINMRAAWELNELKGNHEEIVYLVKKGGARSIRPTLQPAVNDVNQGIVSSQTFLNA
jgi:hypothetical protein